MLLEFIILLALLTIVFSVGLFLLKFVFAVVLLPLKLALFLTKGLLTLLVVIPVMLILGTVFLAALPLGLVFLFLPVLFVGGLACMVAGV